jgi:hypothetical protein
MALGTFILMAGCSAQTGVVPTGQNSYLVAKQATTGFPGLGNLKAEALQEANQYCVGRGSDLFVTRSTETQPPYVLGNYPRAESEFRWRHRVRQQRRLSRNALRSDFMAN